MPPCIDIINQTNSKRMPAKHTVADTILLKKSDFRTIINELDVDNQNGFCREDKAYDKRGIQGAVA